MHMKYLNLHAIQNPYIYLVILIKFIINIMSFISSENVDLYLFTCFPLFINIVLLIGLVNILIYYHLYDYTHDHSSFH